MTVFLTIVLTALFAACVVAFWPFAVEGVDHLAGKLARRRARRRAAAGRHHHGAETVAAVDLVEAHTAALDLRGIAS